MKSPALLAGLLLLTGCPRLALPGNDTPAACPTPRRTDIFDLAGGTMLDVLIIVDTSPRMPIAQNMIFSRLAHFFERFVNEHDEKPGVDFHIAVAPTNLDGVFRAVAPGSAPPGAACEDSTVTRPLTECFGCARYLSAADCTCQDHACQQAHRQLEDLFDVEMDPANSTRTWSPAMTLRRALGIAESPGESRPTLTPPLANTGFYRDEARLLVFIITAGQDDFLDGSNADPANVEGLVREFRTLKGAGRPDDVVFVTITPINSDLLGVPNPTALCVRERARGAATNACASSVVTQGQFPDDVGACIAGGSKGSRNLVALACDMNGVVYNLCATDWTNLIESEELQRLGTSSTSFTLPLAENARPEEPCSPSHGLCVTVRTPEGQEIPLLGSRYALDAPDMLTVQRDGTVRPGARIVVTYDTEAANPSCCTSSTDCAGSGACNEAGFCQQATCASGQQLQCAPGISQCDAVNQTCIPLGQCTRAEHCPFGSRCNCATQTCVSAPP